MRFSPTAISGVHVIDVEPHRDERGYFARCWCRDEFGRMGLMAEWVQCNTSYNARRGTLRGLHYQASPSQETKLVRVIRGAVFDVVLDLRPSSSSFGQWTAVELSVENGRSLYIPSGCAHGFLTLTDHTELFYQISAAYDSDRAHGVRWNDPVLAECWPFEPVCVSSRDGSFPNLSLPAVSSLDGIDRCSTSDGWP